MDCNSNSMEFSEEDKRRENEWEEVVRGRRGTMANSGKRKKSEGASSGGMESEGREGEQKDPKAGMPEGQQKSLEDKLEK